MEFSAFVEEIREFLTHAKAKGAYQEFWAGNAPGWPRAGSRDIVLLPDLALELGHPQDASLSLLLWTEDQTFVKDETITLIGPDIREATVDRLPLGKVVLIAADACDDSTAYDRYRRMDLARFNLALKGFMLRATSQYLREWSRISREAVQGGFSFHILGSALIRELKAVKGVKAAEVAFITRSSEDVNALQATGVKVGRRIAAMHKMSGETKMDCESCEYQDVCNSVAQMKKVER